MKKTLVFVIIFMLFLIDQSVFAQESTINYQDLYEEQVKSNNQLVTIIYSTLGVTLTLVLLFLGANIFYTTRVNKRELELEGKRIQEELNNNLYTQFEQHTIMQEKNIKESIEESISNNISSELDLYDSKIKDLEKKHTKQEIDVLRLNSYYWEYKDVYNNASRFFANLLILKLDTGEPIDLHIDDFIKVFEKTEDIQAYDIKLYIDLLEKMPQEFEAKKIRINSHLTKVS